MGGQIFQYRVHLVETGHAGQAPKIESGTALAADPLEVLERLINQYHHTARIHAASVSQGRKTLLELQTGEAKRDGSRPVERTRKDMHLMLDPPEENLTQRLDDDEGVPSHPEERTGTIDAPSQYRVAREILEKTFPSGTREIVLKDLSGGQDYPFTITLTCREKKPWESGGRSAAPR